MIPPPELPALRLWEGITMNWKKAAKWVAPLIIGALIGWFAMDLIDWAEAATPAESRISDRR